MTEKSTVSDTVQLGSPLNNCTKQGLRTGNFSKNAHVILKFKLPSYLSFIRLLKPKMETFSSNTNSLLHSKQGSGVFNSMLHQHTKLMLNNCFMGMIYLYLAGIIFLLGSSCLFDFFFFNFLNLYYSTDHIQCIINF